MMYLVAGIAGALVALISVLIGFALGLTRDRHE